MNDYAPASAFGWLDLDERASDRAATLLKAFEETSTLDPIGLGSVRDAFSDLLFPGTSTIQTRLRYFLFIPWICQRLQRDGTTPAEFRSRLRHEEARLIDCLRHLGPNQGVIGRISGSDLRRMPSEAYWGGLGTWGIRRLDVSIAEYGRRIDGLGSARVEFDDDRNPITRIAGMWTSMPEAPDDFLQADHGMALSFDEADFVVERIRSTRPDSLMAEMLAFPGEAAAARMPWDVNGDLLSARMRDILRHAEAVSLLTVGAQELYNLLIAERAEGELGWETSALQANVRASLEDWAAEVRDRPELIDWANGSLDSFWQVVEWRGPIPKPTKDFVTEVVRRSATDPGGVSDDVVLRGVIRDRELLLKRSRARLGPRSALESWEQVRFGGPLEYRWPTARGYLRDIAAAIAPVEMDEVA